MKNEYNFDSTAENNVFAKLNGLSEPDVQHLIETKIIEQGETLKEWQHSYLQYLRSNAASNSDVEAYMDMLHAERQNSGRPEELITVIHGETCNVDLLERGIFLLGEAFVNLSPEGKHNIRKGIKLSLQTLN